MALQFQAPPTPNMLQLLRKQPQTQGPGLPLPYPDAASAAEAPPVAALQAPPSPAQPPAPQQPPESAALSAQLQQMNAPPTTKDALLKAVLAFAPTAVAGAFGGLPAASGAAQGANTELNTEAQRQEREKQSLIEQVRAARQMEQQNAQFGLIDRRDRELATQREAGENARNAATIAARPKPNIDPLSPEGIAAKKLEPRNIDPNSPEGISAAVDRTRQERLLPPAALAPIPGRDIPLPEAVARQREQITQAGKTPPEHGVTMIGKDGKVYRLEPGQSVPEGAQTPTQAGSLNTLTTQQRNTASQATLVHEQTPYMLSELDRLKGKLGPMQGRLNELMQGKIGMNDPDFAGLGADLLMYSSAVALMHARGRLPENLREEFQKAIDNPGQDAGNLKAVITKIDGWTVKNPGVNTGGGGGGTSSSGAPSGGNVIRYDAQGNRIP